MLLIDDEELILDFAARALRQAGYEVDVAADPALGLATALTGGHDLVILDLVMPGLSGLTVLDRLVRERPRQRVAVVSAQCDRATRARCAGAGADAFLPKPFTLGELLELVDHVIHRRPALPRVSTA